MAEATSGVRGTLGSLLAESAKTWAEQPALSLYSNEPWSWTYAELWSASRRAAAFLRASGVAKGDRVLLWGDNRPEWVAAFFGTLLLGAIAVPIDAQSTEDFLALIQDATQPRYMFIGAEQKQRLEENHPPFLLFEELITRLETLEPLAEADALAGVEPDDIAELVFTSGTTGSPKGVILTHRNILANVKMATSHFRVTPKHRVLAILPLSHMFEQIADLFVPLSAGATVVYLSSLRPDVIFAAMAHYRITNMGCVPRVLELFADGIKREARRQNRLTQLERAHSLACRLPISWRRLLFKKIHQRMGGCFEYFVVGGARLDVQLGRWWEGLGVKVVQGYGMTEAAPVVAAGTLKERDHSSVGRPLPGVEVKIAEDDEIWVRGENVTPGYWQNPEATNDAFTDGWYKTRDLGYFDSKGRLHIRGRKDNMFVLGNGMNVYPEDIEQVLSQDSRLTDAVVLGLSSGDDVEVHGVLLTTEPEAAADIVRTANGQLAPHQRIQRYTVWPEETFPVTPTMKPKRAEITARVLELRSGSE
ncbi:MAG: AMP-binding protein [Chloroflexi bacterium]|nr:AMP-binding protein [Chloroflexota bacterium]